MFGLPYNVLCGKQFKRIIVRNKEKKISASLEDYLEVIYETINEKQGVKAIDISRQLGVGRSSVSDALKVLAEKQLVNYGRYEVISLTEQGKKIAKEVVGKHNILYDFFINVLELSVEEADKNACRIEHVISDSAIDGIIQFMKKRELNNE